MAKREHAAAVAGNIWKLFIIQACRWFLLLMPVLVLFYQENGLSLQDVFIVQAFFSVCIIIFEVPSGYFSDRLGRRRSLLVGSVAGALGFSSYALAHSLPEFLFAQFLIAIGASFLSGTDHALLYDSLIQLGRQGEFQRLVGRYGSIGNFSEGIAALVGGSMALISLRTPLYCQAVLFLGLIPLAWSLVVRASREVRHRAEPKECERPPPCRFHEITAVSKWIRFRGTTRSR